MMCSILYLSWCLGTGERFAFPLKMPKGSPLDSHKNKVKDTAAASIKDRLILFGAAKGKGQRPKGKRHARSSARTIDCP